MVTAALVAQMEIETACRYPLGPVPLDAAAAAADDADAARVAAAHADVAAELAADSEVLV